MDSTATTCVKPLVIGDIARAEFRDAFVHAEASNGLPRAEYPTIADALQAIRSGATPPPEMIVLACAWPGQFSAAEVEQLRKATPLASIVSVLGPWRQGTNRGYHSTLISIGWNSWPDLAPPEAVPPLTGRVPFTFASTATAEDLLLASAAEAIERRQGTIVLVAKSRSMTEALGDACQLRGYETCAVRQSRIDAATPREALAILWDTTAEVAAAAGHVSAIRRAGNEAPVIALLDFPRPEDVDRGLMAGVATVVAKPLLIENLYQAIDRVTLHAGAVNSNDLPRDA